MNPARYMDIITGQDRSRRARLARLGLGCLAAGYRPIIAARNRLYDAGILKTHSLGRPAISVGNLTAGGTGKTPIVIDIARRLLTLGHQPAVLLRGYHAHQGRSDEAQLLQDALAPDATVHAGASRREMASQALAQQPAIDCFVLDDAFQHRQARRDLDLVLIDATTPLGHGRLLPRGLLREPPANLARASGVILTRANLVEPSQRDALAAQIRKHHPSGVMAQAAFTWQGYRDEQHRLLPLEAMQGRQVLGVCGVGNPAAFERMLCDQLGRQTVVAMDDHYIYRHEDITELFLMAERQNASCVVTTEKDWVKWRRFIPPAGWPVPVYRPVLGVSWLTGEEALQARLEAVMTEGGRA